MPDGYGVWAAIVIVAAFVAGSAFVMWLGEQVTEFGIGNGISIILFAGIVARGPAMVTATGISACQPKAPRLSCACTPPFRDHHRHLALIVFIVFVNDAERRIPVQYAKRVVGRKMYGGQAPPAHEGQYVRRSAHHLRPVHRLHPHGRHFVPSAPEEGTFWYTFVNVFDSKTACST